MLALKGKLFDLTYLGYISPRRNGWPLFSCVRWVLVLVRKDCVGVSRLSNAVLTSQVLLAGNAPLETLAVWVLKHNVKRWLRELGKMLASNFKLKPVWANSCFAPFSDCSATATKPRQVSLGTGVFICQICYVQYSAHQFQELRSLLIRSLVEGSNYSNFA
jgi:hypothetical protein